MKGRSRHVRRKVSEPVAPCEPCKGVGTVTARSQGTKWQVTCAKCLGTGVVPRRIGDRRMVTRGGQVTDQDLDEFLERGCAHCDGCPTADEFLVEALARVTALEDALRELLRHGEHEGPCTNEANPWDDACELHIAAAAERDARARVLLPSRKPEGATP